MFHWPKMPARSGTVRRCRHRLVRLAAAVPVLLSLAGCGAVTGVASGAASIAGAAVDVAGTVVETSVDVVTAPLN
ncbi:hypothetical protein [Azospirillum picis]|uniref:Lipoprotein n=1 Tax=Azospirillum picis TaxID=488438 RepID=A0ABU0MQY7_9PROT|nr:hypothetical protein [Azospirillum picis]MBP2301646.1 hypothetical protein [Azospirillum picis]MDQ0535531.1 hypothetical protein [Azospirillum picis]